MQVIVAIPLELRLAVLVLLGMHVGSLANLAIYRLGLHPRPISPWSRRDPKTPPRRLRDRLPVFGWLGLRREAGQHGAGFWVRPMLLELFCGIGFAALYWWEIPQQGLLPPNAPQLSAPSIQAILHAQYAVHALLMTLMLVASLIDVDGWVIPDAITVPGTLLALVAAASFPWSLLPDFVPPSAAANWFIGGRLLGTDAAYWRQLTADTWQILQPASPELALGPQGLRPQGIRAFPQGWSLAAGLACWWLWCVALMPRTWYPRHGVRRALQLCVARVLRERVTYRILVTGLVGSGGILGVWLPGGAHWVGLLSALVGMTAGGVLVWVVRVLAAVILQKEAMGFGDVTLLAMIGAFLGWQTSVLVFFTAPLFALGLGIIRLIVLRATEIPYGPFLCLATVTIVVYWAPTWSWVWPYFEAGWLVPAVLLGCPLVMAPLLGLTKWIGDMLRGET